MTVSAVAGTFDVVHEGHLELLKRAFETGDEVLVGITSDRMASSKRGEHVPLDLRIQALRRILDGFGKKYELFEIEDIYGPATAMDRADVLVVSEETLESGRAVNEARVERGVKPLELSVVKLVPSDDGEKISSSAILSGRYGRTGHRDVIDIAVGSLNRVKVEAVRNVMERIYGDVRITAVDVPSNVPEQPFEGETRQGAENRACGALGGHDMAVGIEAGVFEFPDGMYDIQQCCIVDRAGRRTYGQGSGFRYPDGIAEKVRGGETVGDACRDLFGKEGIGKKGGAIDMLSRGLLTRLELTEQSVTAAMILRIWEDRDVREAEAENRIEIPPRRVQDDREGRIRGHPQRRCGAQRGSQDKPFQREPHDRVRHAHRGLRRMRARRRLCHIAGEDERSRRHRP